MKRLFTVLAAFLIVLTALPSEHHLGYCYGELSTLSPVTAEGNTWVSGAIYLPPSVLRPYAGGKIVGLRAGLASKINVDTLQLWVRSDLYGENICENTVTKKTDPKLSKGWNEVTFETPYSFDGEHGLYVGCSYHQKGSTGALSVIGSRSENSFYAQLGSTEEWQNLSDMGILCVEAIVESDILISHDLALISASASPDSDPDLNRVSLTVVNNGVQDIECFSLSTKYAHSSEVYAHEFSKTLHSGEKTVVNYTIPAKDIEEAGQIIVDVASLGGFNDEIAYNNNITARYSIMKKVFAEEFTTERCNNCPRVAGYLHDLLAEEKYADRVVALCHHSGFSTDIFTQPIDEDYARFFGINGAPVMMFDRSPLFAGGTSIGICPDKEDIISAFNTLLDREAHVSVAIVGSYDNQNHRLDVTVSGERTSSIGANERIMVYVVENDVKPSSQGQAGITDGEYLHQHVIRAYNDTWGSPIIWDVNSYCMDFSFSIESEWKIPDMQIIAAVGNYDETNPLNCEVDNCEQIKFPDSSAINEITSDRRCISKEYYTIGGIRISVPGVPGVYIEKTNYSDGTTSTAKTVIR